MLRRPPGAVVAGTAQAAAKPSDGAVEMVRMLKVRDMGRWTQTRLLRRQGRAE
jgi:hypothetical protein